MLLLTTVGVDVRFFCDLILVSWRKQARWVVALRSDGFNRAFARSRGRIPSDIDLGVWARSTEFCCQLGI